MDKTYLEVGKKNYWLYITVTSVLLWLTVQLGTKFWTLKLKLDPAMGDILQWVTYYPLLQSPWFYRAKARSCLPRRAKGASFSATCPVPLARVWELILDARCSPDAAGPTLAGHPTLSLPTGVRTKFCLSGIRENWTAAPAPGSCAHSPIQGQRDEEIVGAADGAAALTGEGKRPVTRLRDACLARDGPDAAGRAGPRPAQGLAAVDGAAAAAAGRPGKAGGPQRRRAE